MIISVINLKGGVGKTTTAIALATAAMRDGKDVELFDCDPQSSASLWELKADEAGDPLPFPVLPANVATVRQAGKKLKGKEDRWIVIDCPPNGRVMDEAMICADVVIVPSSTGPADMTKTFETADVLADRGKFYGVLFTMVHPRTLTYRQSLFEVMQNNTSYFESYIPQREALKSFFGNAFGDDLFGYEKVYEEIKDGIAMMAEESGSDGN